MNACPYQAVLDRDPPVIVHGYRDALGRMVVDHGCDEYAREVHLSPADIAEGFELLEAEARESARKNQNGEGARS